jgi:hypothetical protein
MFRVESIFTTTAARDQIMNEKVLKVLWMLILVFLIQPSQTSGQNLDNNNGFYTFLWTRASTDSVNSGCYGLSTISSHKSDDKVMLYAATFRMFPGSWWKNLVAKIETNLNLAVSNSKPDSIDKCSNRFSADTVSWVNSISGNTDKGSYSLRFLFPVLPQKSSYRMYDYFSVLIDSSTILQFYALSDSVFIGSFINNYHTDKGKISIYAKNAIAITTTAANTLRIKSIQFDGKYNKYTSSYLHFNLDTLKSNAAWYGITFIDTVMSNVILKINSISIEGALALNAGSTVRVSWSLSGIMNVTACSLFVSIGSQNNWKFTGRSVAKDTTVSWLVPPANNTDCYLKLKAYGKDYRYSEIQSSRFSITEKIDTQTIVERDTVPENNYRLEGTVIDTSTIGLTWFLKGGDKNSIDSIVILYDEFHHPASIDDKASSRVGIYTPSQSKDTIHGLKTGKNYYFSLFVLDTTGYWSKADSSKLVLTIGSRRGEPIKIGISPMLVFDSLIKISTETEFLVPYVDTVCVWNGPPEKIGFIEVSKGIEFLNGTLPSTTSIMLEIKCTKIPLKFNAADIRVYRFDQYTGQWQLNEEPYTIDTSEMVITTAIKNLKMPTMVMIDTMPPSISSRLNNSTAFSVKEQVADTFTITDNIVNPTVSLFAGTGNERYHDISLYISKKNNAFQTSIPLYLASECTGMRGLFIATDSRNSDTVNLSRAILREENNCDDFTTNSLEWTPITVTAQPEDNHITSALSTSTSTQIYVDYNDKNERIIQWLPLESDNSTENDWIEYAPKLDSLFIIAPGKLLWIKTKDERALKFHEATIASLKDTFVLPLNTKDWTDFSNPFAFDVNLKDIINATVRYSPDILEYIGLYCWVQDDSLRYHADDILLPNKPKADSIIQNTVLRAGTAYTIYLGNNRPDTLRIPPICRALSETPTEKQLSKKSISSIWSIKIRTVNNTGIQSVPLYCTSIQPDRSPYYFPLPPSFTSLRTGILDQKSGTLKGYAATGDLSSGGAVFEILSDNQCDNPGSVSMNIDKTTAIPIGMRVGFFSVVPPGTISLADSNYAEISRFQQKKSLLIVGTSSFIEQFYKAFTAKLAINCFVRNGRLFINYSVPYNSKNLEFAFFDLKGRMVCSHTLAGANLATKGSLTLKNKIAAGFYIAQLRVHIDNSKQVQYLRKGFMVVR